uniref:Uncharacterized protein n=1 Tax=Anopheles atroparvus TaxID=41427 RepID=A0AAG5DBS4_ANOAO
MSPSRMLLVLTVGLTLRSGLARAKNATNVTTPATLSCSTTGLANPRDCCRSFLELHEVIIECLPKPETEEGSPCLAQCVLQSYGMRPMPGNVPMSISRIITLGPKLATHFDQCKMDLYDFLMGSTFQGDFRGVVCDVRLTRFLECMVKSWFQDCPGFEDSNAGCNELRDRMHSSSCKLSSFFGAHQIN